MTRLLALATLIAVTGCAGECRQQSGPLLLDSMMADWAFFEPPASPSAGDLCVVPDAYCPGGKICFQGICEAPVCRASGLCPGGSGSCQPACVPMFDACKGVSCEKGETCVEGHCVRGCFPQPCNGVVCAPGQYCSRSDGKCRALVPCSGSCAPGFECSLVACAPDLCKGVSCPEGQLCSEGKCVANPCAKVTCTDGAICQSGKCVDSCTLFGPPTPPAPTPPAPPTCTPSCTNKSCGASDGCGGICKACVPGQTCMNSATGWLCCAPNCDGKACGAADGCGGTCGKGSCPGPQEVCQNNKCTCVPNCAGKTCNDDNGCGGKCKGCPAPDQVCDTGQAVWVCCTPSCAGKACGGSDGCGGTCKTGSCPSGQSCQSGKCVSPPPPPPVPPPTCGCGQQLVGSKCVPLCAPDTTLCGCSSCCTSGFKCDWATSTCKPGVG